MNRLLIDYCKSRLTDSSYEPEYKEVTNESFAKYIVDVAECIAEIRACVLIGNAADCGLKSAAVLLGVHSICDVRSKKDIEFGGILLNYAIMPQSLRQ
jgi:hypothetical protein